VREKSVYIREKNLHPKKIRGGETKVMKKILSTLLVLAFVFTMVAPAFAADLPLSDIANSASKDAILKLNYAGVLAGYPDGTFKPDQEVTRAEFAKVAVLALGYTEAQVLLFNAPTKFPDVAKDHWANGYINVAVANGILKGDTSGKFRPDDTVTVAEVLTVLVRGLKINVTQGEGAQWYLPYLLEATKVGLYNASESATAPAVRGIVAKFVDAYMETPTFANGAYYDANGNPATNPPSGVTTTKKIDVKTGVVSEVATDGLKIDNASTKTLFDTNVKVYGNVVVGAQVEYVLKDSKIVFLNVLTSATNVVSGVVKSKLDFTTAVGDELKFQAIVDGKEVVLEVANTVTHPTTDDVNKKFTAVKDANGVITSITFSDNTLSGIVEKTLSTSGTTATNQVTVAGKTYTLTSGASVSVKAHPQKPEATGTFDKVAKGDLVTLTFDYANNVTKVVVTKLTYTGAITVNTANNSVVIDTYSYSVLTDTKLYKDGVLKTLLSDLGNDNSIVTFNTDGNLVKVEQGVASLAANYYIENATATDVKVNGVTYTVYSPTTQITIDGENKVLADVYSTIVDYKVSKLVYKVGTTTFTELVADKVTVSGYVTGYTENTDVTLDGVKYTFANPYVDDGQLDATSVTSDEVFTLTLNKDGKVKEVSHAPKTVSGVVDGIATVKENGVVTSNTITVNGKTYVAAATETFNGVAKYDYVTLTLKRDGSVLNFAETTNSSIANVAFKGIVTLIDGTKEVYYTDTNTYASLTSDFVVKYYDGSNMTAADIKTTDTVDLYTIGGNVYLIVVHQR